MTNIRLLFLAVFLASACGQPIDNTPTDASTTANDAATPGDSATSRDVPERRLDVSVGRDTGLDASSTRPASPGNFIVANISASGADATWEDRSDDEQSFFIERWDEVGGSWNELVRLEANTTTAEFAELDANTEYGLRVFAQNGAGLSDPSNEQWFTTGERMTDCGNAVCEAGETCASCVQDCGECPVGGDAIFSDGFETGDRSNSGGGVRWLGATDNIRVSSARSRSGDYALEFPYSGVSDGEDGFAEQRYRLPDTTELWAEYWLYVPENYTHRHQGGPTNWKFFTLFQEPYPSNFSGVAAWSAGDGTSYAMPAYFYEGAEAAARVNPGDDLLTSADRGQWVRLRFHLRRATTPSANDGIVEVWKGTSRFVRWDELGMFNSSNGNHWDTGYLLGWHNGGFSEPTTFYIDDISFFTADPGW